MEEFGNHKLRRAWLSGYRVVDVEILRAQLVLKLTHFATELESVRMRLDTAESERRELGHRLEEAHGRETALTARLAATEAERDRALQQGSVRAAGGREDAERLRGQVEELLRLRATLAESIRDVGEEMERVLENDPGVTGREAAPPRPVQRLATVATPAVDQPTADLYAHRVEIDAGPFTDLASLAAFETSLGRLPKVENVYIRRFHADHATIEVELDQPSPLLDDMTQRMPFGLSAEHVADDRIAVTISGPKTSS